MDKIKFAKNFRTKQDMFNNINKLQKGTIIAVGVPAVVSTALSIINPLFLITLLIDGVIGLPLIGFSQYRKHEIVRECRNGCENPISYKEFKQMSKSGELEKLIQQVRIEEQQEFNEQYKQAFIDVVEKAKPYSIRSTTKSTAISNNSANYNSSYNGEQGREL